MTSHVVHPLADDSDDDWVRLTPEETGLDEQLLARLALRTQHRAEDGAPIMTANDITDQIELMELEGLL